MKLDHPVVQRYLAALASHLGELPEGDRAEIRSEIEAHLDEALAAGRDVEEALAALGPADRLARAYTLETLLNRRPTPGQWLQVLGVVAAATVPSVVLVPLLLGLGLALMFAGSVVWVAGLIAPFAPPDLVIEIDPLLAVTLGPPIALAGAVCLILLALYARLLIRIVRQTARRTGGS